MKEALKLALEALEVWVEGFSDLVDDLDEQAITAIKEALAQPAQEPVAKLNGIDKYGPMLGWYKHWTNFPVGTKLYTTPQQRPWIGLTFAEICECENDSLLKFARAVEAKLKEKNFD